MKQTIQTTSAPAAIGPYAQGIATDTLIFTSGQLPIDANGTMPLDIKIQTQISLQNLKAVVESGGGSLQSILKTTVFLKDMNDFAAMNEVYAQFFDPHFPARSCVEVARLPKDALVEIECIAYRD